MKMYLILNMVFLDCHVGLLEVKNIIRLLTEMSPYKKHGPFNGLAIFVAISNAKIP